MCFPGMGMVWEPAGLVESRESAEDSGGGVGGYTMESLKLSEPNEDSVEERSEGEESGIDARLSVTQSDDPLSGGHLAVGMSKPPLKEM